MTVRPSAGAAVTLGRLAQLSGAFGYLLATVRSQTEPEEILAPAAHLVAAFYGWADPKEQESDRFLLEVCRTRLRLSKCRPWLRAVRSVLETAMADGLRACMLLRFRDSYRHSLLERVCDTLRSQQDGLARLLSWLAGRWPEGTVPRASACRRLAFRGPRVELATDRLVVRGMEVLPLDAGRLALGPEAAEALQAMLVAGTPSGQTQDASSSRPGRGREGQAAPGQSLLLRVSSNVRVRELAKLLRLAAEVNFRRALFRVQGPDGGPCLVEATLNVLPLPPRGPRCEFLGHSVRLCQREGTCRKLAEGETVCRVWVLRGGTVGRFLQALAAAGPASVIWLEEALSLTLPRRPRPGPGRSGLPRRP